MRLMSSWFCTSDPRAGAAGAAAAAGRDFSSSATLRCNSYSTREVGILQVRGLVNMQLRQGFSE